MTTDFLEFPEGAEDALPLMNKLLNELSLFGLGGPDLIYLCKLANGNAGVVYTLIENDKLCLEQFLVCDTEMPVEEAGRRLLGLNQPIYEFMRDCPHHYLVNSGHRYKEGQPFVRGCAIPFAHVPRSYLSADGTGLRMPNISIPNSEQTFD